VLTTPHLQHEGSFDANNTASAIAALGHLAVRPLLRAANDGKKSPQ